MHALCERNTIALAKVGNVIHNVYNTRVKRPELSRVSYNGGNDGINARATAQEECRS
jgi:hypothetical protein